MESFPFSNRMTSTQLLGKRLVSLTSPQNLTNALKEYDLRDWMLISSRKPGPRAKKVDFPVISYGTLRTGMSRNRGI